MCFEGCDREVKASKSGLRLCKLHGAKEERAKPTVRPKGSSSSGAPVTPQPTILQIDPEARFAPGGESRPISAQPATQANPQATALGKYLREILEGKDEAASLKACALSGCGPREDLGRLQSPSYCLRHEATQGLSS